MNIKNNYNENKLSIVTYFIVELRSVISSSVVCRPRMIGGV